MSHASRLLVFILLAMIAGDDSSAADLNGIDALLLEQSHLNCALNAQIALDDTIGVQFYQDGISVADRRSYAPDDLRRFPGLAK